ncbi:hypothetical protein SAMD00019534_001330 [Acytostelium subglobosum LB1]|uniref:hypothetical protein n=1 Tax=Acytostelium subglobosum LB1 TaxID=1410327 RepID=UPI000644AB6E|nr:hypothetical protein SAMD00019534_001330 [Acytostelium subglobosum LB1]GAM16958.1 hypothetical protein SAMD00019534_001330 [Acytostelium subglobosum LB1]|eukprot:XP_012759020.1 hypothetical protein SAMD00019534_001330 [Acytostelium subglobosum LB1]
MSYKTLFMVGLLVIVLDSQLVSAQEDSSQASIDNPAKQYCLGNTFDDCTTAGACCVWCTNVTITNTTGSVNVSTGVCVYNEKINFDGVCPGTVSTLFAPTSSEKAVCPVGFRSNAACTCSYPLFSNDSSPSVFKPSFLLSFILVILSIL